MILTAKLDRVLIGKSGAVVSFTVPAYLAKSVEEMDPEKEYKLELTEIKSKRSLWQNRYMWQLIHEIAKSQGMDEETVYCQIIKLAKIKTEFVETIPEAIDRLKRVFRVCVERDRRTSPKGTETVVLECYFGTSTFDTHEMSEFIDRLLDYASEVGVNLTEYGGYR